MPIIKSAKKRVRVSKKAAVRNSKSKRSLKSAVKAFHDAVSSSSSKTSAAHKKAQSELDKAGKKKIMHKNKVARKKSQLAKLAKKNATAKKPAAKKAPAKKKPAAKK